MIFPGVVIGGRLPEIEWTHTASSTSNATSYTFNSVALGVEHPSRLIAIGATARGILGITIGGVAATRAITPLTNFLEMWQAAVPTGATATVIVTSSAVAADRCMIEVWALRYLRSHTAVAAANGTAAEPSVAALSVPSRGVVAAYAIANGAVAWTEPTGDHGASVEGVFYGAASAAYAVAATVNVTAGDSGAAGVPSLVAAAWR